MPNHPNRSRRDNPAANPSPEIIRARREVAGLTQKASADLLHTSTRTWQQWEKGDRRMHPAFWELYCIKSERRQRQTLGGD